MEKLVDYKIEDFESEEDAIEHCFQIIVLDGGIVDRKDNYYIYDGNHPEALRCGRLLVNKLNYLRLGNW
jgi:hypothetical protein